MNGRAWFADGSAGVKAGLADKTTKGTHNADSTMESKSIYYPPIYYTLLMWQSIY